MGLFRAVLGKGGAAPGDLGDLLGDFRLPRHVEPQIEGFEELLGVLRGALHGVHAGKVLRSVGLHQGAEDPGGDKLGHQLVEDLLGRGV